MPKKKSDLEPNVRDRLIQAAVRLFGEEGFDATSLRTVAKEANTSWSLVRFYFGSKEGLRDAVEDWVVDGYLELALTAARSPNDEQISEAIEQRTRDLPDVARYLRRAIIEGRPIGLEFLERLMAADSVYAHLHADFPAETWLVDPMRTVASRLGYLLLAPQFQALLGRDPFSKDELKRRNQQTSRMLSLVRRGLEAERKDAQRPKADPPRAVRAARASSASAKPSAPARSRRTSDA